MTSVDAVLRSGRRSDTNYADNSTDKAGRHDVNCLFEIKTCSVGISILIWFSLIWPTFENFIVSLGQHANFLPESYMINFIAIDCYFST